MIDGAEVEVDGGYGEPGSADHVKAFLSLEGDMVDECEKYLNDLNSSRFTVEVPYNVAKELYDNLGEVLYG